MMTNEEAIRILDPATTREALVEIEYHAGFNGQRAVMEAVNEACMMGAEALRNERPKGRWELIHDDWNVYQCTECKEWWTLECATPQENNMNFCPFCGADMREEKNNER